MSRLAMFCTGLFFISSLSGCCLMHGMGGGYPAGGGYYGGQGGGCGCNPSGAYAPGGYPSAAMYGAGPQTAFAVPTQTAFAPLDPLPTR